MRKTKKETDPKDHKDGLDCWCKPDIIFLGESKEHPELILFHHNKKKALAKVSLPDENYS